MNSTSRLIRVSIGLIDSFLVPLCFRQGSLSNACIYIQQTYVCCFLFLIWRPPALPHRLQCSTIGRLRLNRRVRDGNGCFPQAHRHQKFRVIQVSAQVWEKGCWKLASIRAFYHTCICDAVATEWIEDSWGALTIITQIYMYAVFKVRYWLNLYQSYKKKSFLFILYHW